MPGDAKAHGEGGVGGGLGQGERGLQVYRETQHRTLHLPGYTCFGLHEAAVASSALGLRGFSGFALSALLASSLASLKPCDLSDPLCAEHTLFHRSHITILELQFLSPFCKSVT